MNISTPRRNRLNFYYFTDDDYGLSKLKNELEKHGLKDLLKRFRKWGVDFDTVWTLDAEECNDIGLNLKERRRYFAAIQEITEQNSGINIKL